MLASDSDTRSKWVLGPGPGARVILILYAYFASRRPVHATPLLRGAIARGMRGRWGVVSQVGCFVSC